MERAITVDYPLLDRTRTGGFLISLRLGKRDAGHDSSPPLESRHEDGMRAKRVTNSSLGCGTGREMRH